MAFNRGEIMKLLTLACVRTEEISAASDELSLIQVQLGINLSLLITAGGNSCATFTEDLQRLSDQDPRLQRFLHAQ